MKRFPLLLKWIPTAGFFLFLIAYFPGLANAEEFQSLFNGQDLAGWQGDPTIWSVEEGAITGQTTADHPLEQNTFLVWTGGQVDDFELRLEYRLQGGNSGIQYRSRVLDQQKHIVGGYQADMEAGPKYTGILYEERGRGILAKRGERTTIDAQGKRQVEKFGDAAELQKVIHPHDWNHYVVIAKGPRLRHFINGQLMSETIDQDKKARAASGVLALQIHKGPPMKVQFRNIRLRRLGADAAKKQSQAAPHWKSDSAATPAETLTLLPGFHAELIYSVPREKEGSWVSMTVDPQGRLIVSDQGKAGLFRITPPALGEDASKTKVEKIELPISMAQGMTCAFDSLYVVVNDGDQQGKRSGLYRLRDTDGDDQYDQLRKLRDIHGRSEHGPHAIVPSPDGKTLTLIAGNHTHLPHPESSVVPRVWKEDLLHERIWDVNGHAVGIEAPGGWICRLDPEGKTWELFSMGYRNPYDIAYNRAGELFTYDADMEWDLGLPWYRPTRVCHVTSGSEFGWRAGSGKWPPYYPDSLPAMLNIGTGSPTGITFGYGAKFPEKYRHALFICDWSFCKLYALHLEPKGATYRATREEFVTGAPLPLTDIVINPHDGAMYFTIGGRNTQSGLYRVTYSGDDLPKIASATAPASTSSNPTPAAQLRRQLEAWHGKQDPTAVDAAWPSLDHADRFVRFAARTAIEWQPVQQWQDRALAETRVNATIEAMVALARCGDKNDATLAPRMIQSLGRLAWPELTEPQQLGLLRAYGLIWTRLDPSDPSLRSTVAARLNNYYPAADNAKLNRELSRLLTYLGAPDVVAKTIQLLETAPTQEEQIHYAFVLRERIAEASPALQQRYFRWFEQVRGFHGGHSMRGFVEAIRDQAAKGLSDDRRTALADALAIDLANTEPLPTGPARTFVKKYTVEEIVALLNSHMHHRDFDRGRRLFATALCFRCHRLGGEGGSTGPDLTAAGRRFSHRDLAEAIVDPSKVVSDQYRATQFLLNSGKVVKGRIANLSNNKLMVVTNMLAPGDYTTIDRSEIESSSLVAISEMPEGLLNTFSEDEIRDLLAYLISGGNEQSDLFSGGKNKK